MHNAMVCIRGNYY